MRRTLLTDLLAPVTVTSALLAAAKASADTIKGVLVSMHYAKKASAPGNESAIFSGLQSLFRLRTEWQCILVIMPQGCRNVMSKQLTARLPVTGEQ